MSSLCSISRIVRPARFQVADERLHLRGLGRVHAGGRLVEQQQARAQRQRAGDLDAAAVGVGEAVGGMVEARRQPVAEAGRGSRALRRAAPRSSRATRGRADQRQRKLGERPEHRQRGRTARSRVCAPISTLSSTLRLANTRPCWNVRAMPSAAIASGGSRSIGAAFEQDLAGVRPVEAADQVEHRRLAGAVRADEADELAFVDVEIERRRPP